MALSTYSELQTAIATHLDRSDMTAAIQDFILLAESNINRDVRHWKMQNRATAELDSQYLQRPSDWVETISFRITGSYPQALSQVSQDTMIDIRGSTSDTAGKPQYFCNAEDAFEVYPTPDEAYTVELLYTQKVPALSDANTSNWLLTLAPDVYLYGALIHSAPYLVEDARIGVWKGLYQEAVMALNTMSRAAKYSGTGLRTKIRGLG